MQIPANAVLLRIFIGENDRHDHRPLYEAIVLRARELLLAGATVLRGPMGCGHSSRLHTARSPVGGPADYSQIVDSEGSQASCRFSRA
jgi:PII-like signaling protein